MPDSLFIEFPPVTTEEWEAAVRLDLKGKDPGGLGKILYRLGDWTPGGTVQPWPKRPWQIWTQVSDLAAAKRAIECGAEGLAIANPAPEWAAVLDGIHLHTSANEGSLMPWAAGLTGTVEAESISTSLPHFRAVRALEDSGSIHRQIEEARSLPDTLDLIVPIGTSYFEEIAKFRALRRLKPFVKLIARTSRWYETAYDPHVNLLRGATEAMSAIIGGCDALIVGPFTEARGASDQMAERLALNTQLLLRDESHFGSVADPAAGSWYIESLTEKLLRGEGIPAAATAFVGVNRHPNPNEAVPEAVTMGRAMSPLEQCRMRSQMAARRPTVRLVRGTDEKTSRARAEFARDFFVAGGFEVVESGEADLVVLCDADANYPALRSHVDSKVPVIAAGPDFNRNSDHAATIAEWQQRLGI